MSTNSLSRIIDAVPIIGIQCKVETQKMGNEFQVEYLMLNREKLIECMGDPKDISPLALFDLILSAINMHFDTQSVTTKDKLVLETILKDDHTKMFYSALDVVLDSETVDKLVEIKEIREKMEYPFDNLIL